MSWWNMGADLCANCLADDGPCLVFPKTGRHCSARGNKTRADLRFRCLRCGTTFDNTDAVTLMIRGVVGSRDGALWFHGAHAAANNFQTSVALEIYPVEQRVRPGADPGTLVVPLNKFCGPIEVESDRSHARPASENR